MNSLMPVTASGFLRERWREFHLMAAEGVVQSICCGIRAWS
jgi:hypothetical protein